MATLTTGVVLLRWQLLSAVMMFLASTLNIRFRRSDYVGLAVISSGLGVVSACWFAMGLLGITMADITAIWHNIESVMIEEMNQTATMANDFDLIRRSLHNGGFFFMAGRCFNHPP